MQHTRAIPTQRKRSLRVFNMVGEVEQSHSVLPNAAVVAKRIMFLYYVFHDLSDLSDNFYD